MERREALAKSAAGVATVLIPKSILPFTPPETPAAPDQQFSKLWREGHLAFYFSEHQRALEIFQEAARFAARLDVETQADVQEMISNVREALVEDESRLAEIREELQADPASLSKQIKLAERLQRLGRYEEAEANYRQVLSREDELLAQENAELWRRIGRYHYRSGRYREAAEWFERTPELLPFKHQHTPKDTPEEYLLMHIEAEATLDRLLAATALGDKGRARELAQVYISKVGRLPWPHRWYLRQAGIDSDGMYLQAGWREGPV
jgi:tetratricopeptide (TPR) repeat protein